jgi:hypothetical protein
MLAIGLGAGLGLGLKRGIKGHAGVNPFAVGGAINPAYYSTRGAFNGSALAYAALPLVERGSDDSQLLFYQHYTGQIRYVQFDHGTGDLSGGSQSEIIAIDARNATPIASVN